MQQENKCGPSSDEPAEGRDDIPQPEKGSPQAGNAQHHGDAEKRLEKGEDNDPNPLAPPVNTQAGS